MTGELALDLFELSERYMIYELKIVCERYLAGLLTLDNCFKIFEVAYLYGATFLKEEILGFFKVHLSEITERKDLEDLPKWSYIHIKIMQWNEINEAPVAL